MLRFFKCLWFIVLLLLVVNSFRLCVPGENGKAKLLCTREKVNLRSVAGIVAGLAFGTHFEIANFHVLPPSVTMALAETKQGLYREYTVEKVDDSALDAIKRSYKTAEETDTSKNKYWTILAVLVAGSFVIPMVQYFWYVAEED